MDGVKLQEFTSIHFRIGLITTFSSKKEEEKKGLVVLEMVEIL